MQSFREMTEKDIPQIAELEKMIFSDAWSVQSVYDTFQQKQAFVTVADVDGEVVGYCIVYYAMDEGEIARIAVEEKERRHGTGFALLNFTCDMCKERKIERLLLDVRESNMPARRFYEKYGFCQDGIRKNFYEQPKEDAVLMSMEITCSMEE